MSDLPDVGATVKLVKEILSESLDLVSEKRRFRAFLQDYARRAHTEQGLLLEGKHLKALVSGMGYPGFDEVVSGNKAAARSVGLRGLGDWLARTEGYDKALCQWVEEVWSHALGLGGRKPVSDLSKAKEAAGQAGHRRVEQKKADGADWAVAAEQGDADAQFRLGFMYLEGRGVQQDDGEAVKLFGQAAEQGHAAAQNNLGAMYYNGRGVQQDDEGAVKWYRLAAEQGDATAQNNLGGMYKYGRGIRQDSAEAVKWYRLAAEQGHAAAQNNLGAMYYNGRGVQQDDEGAVKWYRLAAEQGDATAQNNLGGMYKYGRGIRQDSAEAVKWYRLAAEQGHATAQNNLGGMYYNGRGVRQDDEGAVKWYRLAAEQGDAAAQYNLGGMYREGRGVQQDDEGVVKWYKLAAKQGDAAAQTNLGAMYENGRGVRQDDEEAVKWYRLAAEQGHAAARYNLGEMYYNGRGVQQDNEAAVKWYKRAAKQGHADAQASLGKIEAKEREAEKWRAHVRNRNKLAEYRQKFEAAKKQQQNIALGSAAIFAVVFFAISTIAGEPGIGFVMSLVCGGLVWAVNDIVLVQHDSGVDKAKRQYLRFKRKTEDQYAYLLRAKIDLPPDIKTPLPPIE